MKNDIWLYIGLGAAALYAVYILRKPVEKVGEDVSTVTHTIADDVSLLNIKDDYTAFSNLFDAYNRKTEENSAKMWNYLNSIATNIKDSNQPNIAASFNPPKVENKTIIAAGGDTRVLSIPKTVQLGKLPVVTYEKKIPIPEVYKTPSQFFNIVNNPFGALTSK